MLPAENPPAQPADPRPTDLHPTEADLVGEAAHRADAPEPAPEAPRETGSALASPTRAASTQPGFLPPDPARAEDPARVPETVAGGGPPDASPSHDAKPERVWTSVLDLSDCAAVLPNPALETLVRHCVESDGCRETPTGAIAATTGKYTGRTPKDKAVVRDETTEADVWWENNHPMTPEVFAGLKRVFEAYARGKRLYVVDAYAGADPAHRLRVRFLVERPYHALFVRDLLIRPTAAELLTFEPDWTVVDFGGLKLDPATPENPGSGTPGEATVALNVAERTVLIAGTEYAGEMKKAVFTVMNLLLPKRGVLPMHCSANVGADGRSALFFGLSGTGKTTLSADPERGLVGDDEHGWSDDGIFNIEGGCYAKCIGLSEAKEPEIFRAVRAGAVLENVVLNDRAEPQYDDASLTENTRAAYPIEHVANAVHPSVAGHPGTIVFLTADAEGVFPPIARLTREQAMFFFLNGYTSKLAGTEAGVTEPQPVFSTCFGAPFLPLRPSVYAGLLGEKIDRHAPAVWLVNTGWTGGGYGVGGRMDLAHTRAMLRAALDGALDGVPTRTEPVFGLAVPTAIPGVPERVLDPRSTWNDPEAYDAAAAALKAKFDANAAKHA